MLGLTKHAIVLHIVSGKFFSGGGSRAVMEGDKTVMGSPQFPH